MLRRRTLNDEQENELKNFDASASLTTASPNRSKYEGKFVKAREERRPLGEKTNKVSKNGVESGKGSKPQFSDKVDKKESEKEENSSTTSNTNTSTTTTSTNTSSNPSNTQISSKVDELTMALSETLKENEQLHDTVTLLKAEIDRLNDELLEYKEYAELYLLGKELIENQAEEIENLKKKLVKRD